MSEQEKPKSVAKTGAISLAEMAPNGVDGRVWARVLKEQLLSAKPDGTEPTNEELLYFARVCQASGLDPARREIYGIYRSVKQKDGTYKPKLSIQTGIDGFRATAEKTGKYAGSKEPEFVYDSEYKITVLSDGAQKTVPNVAKVTVMKLIGDRVVDTTRTAQWADFYPGDRDGKMWRKMPETMLAKVAEAQALRVAFPNCGQLYLVEEMQKPDEGEPGAVEADTIKASIKNAKTLDDLLEIVTGLTVEQQRSVVELAAERQKELSSHE